MCYCIGNITHIDWSIALFVMFMKFLLIISIIAGDFFILPVCGQVKFRAIFVVVFPLVFRGHSAITSYTNSYKKIGIDTEPKLGTILFPYYFNQCDVKCENCSGFFLILFLYLFMSFIHFVFFCWIWDFYRGNSFSSKFARWCNSD